MPKEENSPLKLVTECSIEEHRLFAAIIEDLDKKDPEEAGRGFLSICSATFRAMEIMETGEFERLMARLDNSPRGVGEKVRSVAKKIAALPLPPEPEEENNA